MKPKQQPTTDEWTERLRQCGLSASMSKHLATEINAALAAEREQLRLANINACEAEARANDAEASREDEGKLIRKLSDDVMQLSEQLAAAVEALKVLREHLLIGDTRGRGIIDAALAKIGGKK